MLDGEKLKEYFYESFKKFPYTKIQREKYDEIRAEREMFFDNYWCNEFQNASKINFFSTYYTDVQKENCICFAIKFDLCLFDSFDENQIKQQIQRMPDIIKDFVSTKKYKNVRFYLRSEIKDSKFAGIVFCCAENN